MRSSRSSPTQKRTFEKPRPKLNNAKAASVYPFTAIIGQEEMKLALILNAIDPLIGGVLIMGHRGTGKSTAVRGLAELLPEIRVVRDCVFRCDPKEADNLCFECQEQLAGGAKLDSENAAVRVINLPLGATEDRVCGSIDVQRVLHSGVKAFEPGLLAHANRGFLYIDEVNLLDDHLVDVLLDAAATGRNRVEREGVSIEHPARFVLIGSGNPEEGELRPQLQDRFGLHVEVTTDNSPDSRMAVVEKRVAFDQDPEAFLLAANAQQTDLRDRLTNVRKRLAKVKIARTLLRQIASLCSELQVDGHRGELTIARAARALAAFEGRRQVTIEDARRVAAMSLRHRLRRDALEETASAERIREVVEQTLTSPSKRERVAGGEDGELWQAARGGENGQQTSVDLNSQPPRLSEPADLDSTIQKLTTRKYRAAKAFGKGDESVRKPARANRIRQVSDTRGRFRRAVAYKTLRLAIEATIRALAAQLGMRLAAPGPIGPESWRYKLFTQKTGTLFILAIDTSGSMALGRIRQAKGALLQILKRSYINRDQVAVVAFGGSQARLLLTPSRSVLRARRVLDALSMGGSTPMPAALACTLEVAKRAARQQSGEIKLLIFTDGRANVPLRRNFVGSSEEKRSIIKTELEYLGLELRRAGVAITVVGSEDRLARTGDTFRLAELLKAELVQITRAQPAKQARSITPGA